MTFNDTTNYSFFKFNHTKSSKSLKANHAMYSELNEHCLRNSYELNFILSNFNMASVASTRCNLTYMTVLSTSICTTALFLLSILLFPSIIAEIILKVDILGPILNYIDVTTHPI